MNMNLKYYEQMEIIPIYQSSIILTNVLCGAIIFQEMEKYNWWKIMMLSIGFMICISGVSVIILKGTSIKARGGAV
jgi:hypothetical protein